MVRRMVFSRSRYFFGKILSVDDLTAEHNYFLKKQRLRNQLVFGDGIVSGLSVAVGKEGSNRRVVLSPGLAIDPTGNEICVRDVMTCARHLLESESMSASATSKPRRVLFRRSSPVLTV